MTTEPDLQGRYLALAEARLESAGLLFRQHPNCPFDDGIASIITRCNIAMFVWTSAVDLGSCLMIQEGQRVPRGYSTDITIFMTRGIGQRYPGIGLTSLWDDLVQLHNIQHRADHQAARFTDSCRNSHEAFATINQLLVSQRRLVPESYEWLANLGVR